MIKHTPGPWTAEKTSDGVTIGDGPRLIVVVGCDEVDEEGNECMSKEQAANARLIQAAPEMADELARIARALAEEEAGLSRQSRPTPQRIRFALKHARAALAKAGRMS